MCFENDETLNNHIKVDRLLVLIHPPCARRLDKFLSDCGQYCFGLLGLISAVEKKPHCHPKHSRPFPGALVVASEHACISCHTTGPLVKDETVVAFILSLPRKLLRGLVNRAALFAWWTGAWANEGDV